MGNHLHNLLLTLLLGTVVFFTPPATTATSATTRILATAPKSKAIPSVKLPIFTASENHRPAAITKVKAMSGSIVFDHIHDCGSNQQWELWSEKKSGAATSIIGLPKTVNIGCNHDQSFRGQRKIGKGTTGISCRTVSTCDSEPCTDAIGVTTFLFSSWKKFYTFMDPQCFLVRQDSTLRHRWGNHEKNIRQLASKTPKGANETLDDIYVNIATREPGMNEGIDPSSRKFLAHMLWGAIQDGPLADHKLKSYRCNDGCKYGKNIKIRYASQSKSMHFFLTPKCDWFTICANWQGKPNGVCSFTSTVNVMLRNGFVAFDAKKTQVPIRLLREDEQGKGIVRVDISLLGKANFDNKYAQLMVTSMFRQRVTGEINLGQDMLVTFSHPDCLHPEFGLRAQTDEVDVLILTTDTDAYTKNVENMNRNNNKLDINAQNETIDGREVLTASAIVLDSDNDTTSGVLDVTAQQTTTTTMTPMISVNFAEPQLVDEFEDKANWEGHATWAIFYGWLIGSFLAMIVMTPTMYFCRRILYNDWYRGMFKRYGCDASGTTGGITGASFGDETTGAITVGTQMETGATTSGISQISMAGTTGGETQTTSIVAQ